MNAISDPEILAGYLTDASNVHGAADRLVRPTTIEEVAEVVAHCQRVGIPLTISAGRTSTTAGAVPEGGWVLSTERLQRVGPVQGDRVTAQAGANLGALQDEVESRGLFYPPDPTSRRDCTLGASIACNASGARSFRYGPTRPWVEALTVVLPSGQIRHVERGEPAPADWPVLRWREPHVKTAAGYAPSSSLLDLFIGQEGTLGVIVDATVRLIPLPTEVFGLLAYFPSRQSAVDFMREARSQQRADPAGPVSPRCIEYLDHHCLGFARERVGAVPPEARAALFCEQEVSPSVEHLDAWWALLQAHGAIVDDTVIAADAAGQAKLHALRHAIPAGINERVVKNGMRKIGTDLSVPDEGLDAMMDAYEAAPLDHVLFGHLGDNHLHLNLLPTNQEELDLALRTYDALARQAVSLGGSVSAEHGIGKLKRKHLAWMIGEDVLADFARLKQHLDPHWILGRGNILPSPL
jgi:D-lactate dehydrogenase (cytochrome)